MYEQNENPWQNRQQPHQSQSSKGNVSNLFATAALVCAILSIALSCCGGGIILGSFAILFGLLSRGARKKSFGTAKASIMLGSAGILISAVLIATSWAAMIKQYGGWEEFADAYTKTYNYILENGFDLNSLPDESFPTDFYGDSDFL